MLQIRLGCHGRNDAGRAGLIDNRSISLRSSMQR